MEDIVEMKAILDKCIWVANFKGVITDEEEQDARKALNCLINCAIEKGKEKIKQRVSEDDYPIEPKKKIEYPTVGEDGEQIIYF